MRHTHILPAKVRIYVAGKSRILRKSSVVIILGSSRAERRSATIVALAALAVVIAWQGLRWFSPGVPQDFEECAEQAQNTSESIARNALMVDCGTRFAGRRKADGGYTYYDFLQNRSFDISGPNPTDEERKRIDLEYVNFLDSERRDAVATEFAKRHTESLLADFENVRRPPIVPPTILTPKSQPASPPNLSVRKSSPHCMIEGSLSCSWEKLTSSVKNAFASTSKPGSN